jgi:hypothetical protein
VTDIVAEDEGDGVVADLTDAEDERLGQPVGSRLPTAESSESSSGVASAAIPVSSLLGMPYIRGRPTCRRCPNDNRAGSP